MRESDAGLITDVEGASEAGHHEPSVPVEAVAALGAHSGEAGQTHRLMFSAEGFRSLVQSEFVTASYPIGVALRRAKVPVLDAAPDVADAWVFGLYTRVLARLPDKGGRAAFTASLRRGSDPHSMLETLLHSDEGIHQAATAPDDVDEAFISGAYLVVLGRAPDPDGAAGHLALLHAHGSHQQVLDDLMASDEAQRLLRFPPAPISRDRLIGEALQRILYGVHEADQTLTRIFAAAYAGGGGTRQLARLMLRRDRRLKGMLRSLFVTRNLARLIEIEASAHGARLEALANRQWEWRVARKTWQRNNRLEVRLGDLSVAALHGVGP